MQYLSTAAYTKAPLALLDEAIYCNASTCNLFCLCNVNDYMHGDCKRCLLYFPLVIIWIVYRKCIGL